MLGAAGAAVAGWLLTGAMAPAGAADRGGNGEIAFSQGNGQIAVFSGGAEQVLTPSGASQCQPAFTKIALGSVTTTIAGGKSGTVKLPAKAAPGAGKITATGTGGLSASITVTIT